MLGTILGWLSSSVIDSVGDAIDKNITNDEEREILKNELSKIKNDAEIRGKELDNDYESELTERLKIDMASDSWLAKNVRPLMLIFLTVVLVILSFFHGNLSINGEVFTVAEEYIDLYKSLLMTAFGFYYSSRSIEKVAEIFKR